MANISLPINYFANNDSQSTFGKVQLFDGSQAANCSVADIDSYIFLSHYNGQSIPDVLYPTFPEDSDGFVINSTDGSSTSRITYAVIVPTSQSDATFNNPVGIHILDSAPGHQTFGQIQMQGGSPNTVTINTSYASVNSHILLTKRTGTSGAQLVSMYTIGNIIAGTSFDITSSQFTDDSVLDWFLLIGANDGFIINRPIGYPILNSTAGAETFGTVQLISGQNMVETTSVEADSIIMVSQNTVDLTHAGIYRVDGVNAGIGFDVHSSNGNDNSIMNWWILKSTKSG